MSITYLYRSVAAAKHAFGLLTARSARICEGTRLANHLEVHNRGFRAGRVTTGRPRIPDVGDQRDASRLHVRDSSGSFRSVTEDWRYVRVGRGVVILQFFDSGGPLNPSLQSRLTRVVAGRMQAQLVPLETRTAVAGAVLRPGRIEFRVVASRPQPVIVNWTVVCRAGGTVVVDRYAARTLAAPGRFVPRVPSISYRSDRCRLTASAAAQSASTGGRLSVSIWASDRALVHLRLTRVALASATAPR